jgi:hypothetical protein
MSVTDSNKTTTARYTRIAVGYMMVFKIHNKWLIKIKEPLSEASADTV